MTATLELEPVTWDTGFFGVTVFRADTPNAYFAKGCTYLLLDAGEQEKIQDAETVGFRTMDIRVTLEQKTRPYNWARIRPCQRADVDGLSVIARTAHRGTRYYADPNFPDDRCDDLYEMWIRNSADGWADRVLAAGPVGSPTGYVTLHAEDETASIGLIAVHEQARRNGIGSDLVRAASAWAYAHGCSRMTVVTQGWNVQAQRLFQRCDFRTVKTEVWLHRWYDTGA